jgi:hypothetical protein
MGVYAGPQEPTGIGGSSGLVPRLQALVCTNVLFQAAVITLFVQLPSFADVYKYEPRRTYLAPALVLVTFAAVAAALYGFPRLPRARRILGHPGVTVLLLAGIAVAAEILYHHELARIGRGLGSTAAPAMMDPVRALWHGHGLYSVHLLGGAPVSPGPGWLLLNSPFTFAHLYPLMDPAWLALTAVVLRVAYRRGFAVNLGLAILCSSATFYRLLGEGHDIIAVSCAVVLVVVCAERWLASPWAAAGLGAIVGVVSTARVVYLPLALLVALLVWTRNPRWAVILGGVGVGTALVLFLAFSVGVHPYPPMHLFGRADQRQPVALITIGAALVVLLCLGAIRYLKPGAISWFGWFAAIFATAHLFIGLGELVSGGYAFATWEGANYVFAVALPVIVAVLAVAFRERTDRSTRRDRRPVSLAEGRYAGSA